MLSSMPELFTSERTMRDPEEKYSQRGDSNAMHLAQKLIFLQKERLKE